MNTKERVLLALEFVAAVDPVGLLAGRVAIVGEAATATGGEFKAAAAAMGAVAGEDVKVVAQLGLLGGSQVVDIRGFLSGRGFEFGAMLKIANKVVVAQVEFGRKGDKHGLRVVARGVEVDTKADLGKGRVGSVLASGHASEVELGIVVLSTRVFGGNVGKKLLGDMDGAVAQKVIEGSSVLGVGNTEELGKTDDKMDLSKLLVRLAVESGSKRARVVATEEHGSLRKGLASKTGAFAELGAGVTLVSLLPFDDAGDGKWTAGGVGSGQVMLRVEHLHILTARKPLFLGW
jgi:hypothetical protein